MTDFALDLEEHVEEHGLEWRPLVHEASDHSVEGAGISRGGDRCHREMCLCESLSHELLWFERG
jgi:hypothetical protein